MMKELILKYALQNAIKFDGRANASAVIGKVLSEKPELKGKELFLEVEKIVREVNSLSIEEQKKRLEEIAPKLLEKKKKDKIREIEPLPNARNIVVRFAPNPNGALSIGHCRQALWNWFYVKKYNGTYILRFDDTDAKIKVPIREAYKWITDDLRWLGVRLDKIIIQSKRLEIYYKYAEKLIGLDKAYVCLCDVEKWRSLIKEKKACPCRNLPVKEQLQRWNNMFKKYKGGQAVYRIKTELNHPNPSVRDWPAFRIVDKPKHPLKKAKVWPLLNFASAIDDYEFKVTHILRGIDLKISDDRQKYIYKFFNWNYPFTMYSGKLLVKGVKSTSEIGRLIGEGKLIGWDDPRLGTIKALRRKGFQKETIIKFIEDIGFGRADLNVSMESLVALNKAIVEKSNRYFFVENPKKIKIKGAPMLNAKIPLHPDYKKKGNRIFKTGNEFYVQDGIEKDKVYRLMHLFNFKNNQFISKEYNQELNAKIIHWLPVSKDLVKVEIVMNDDTIKKGLAEKSIKNVKVNQIIQFERFAFCKLDKKEKNKLIFWFTHQ